MWKLKFTALVALIAFTPLTATAMDARYQDTDGDLVADAPKDEKDWIDPATLVFSYTPVEDPAVYGKVWEEFIDKNSRWKLVKTMSQYSVVSTITQS